MVFFISIETFFLAGFYLLGVFNLACNKLETRENEKLQMKIKIKDIFI